MRNVLSHRLWLVVSTLLVGLGQIGFVADGTVASAADPSSVVPQPANTWVKRSPLPTVRFPRAWVTKARVCGTVARGCWSVTGGTTKEAAASRGRRCGRLSRGQLAGR
jgi:hypothetical protein